MLKPSEYMQVDSAVLGDFDALRASDIQSRCGVPPLVSEQALNMSKRSASAAHAPSQHNNAAKHRQPWKPATSDPAVAARCSKASQEVNLLQGRELHISDDTPGEAHTIAEVAVERPSHPLAVLRGPGTATTASISFNVEPTAHGNDESRRPMPYQRNQVNPSIPRQSIQFSGPGNPIAFLCACVEHLYSVTQLKISSSSVCAAAYGQV